MNVLILGGFLGSGKTTLLLRLLEHAKKVFPCEIPAAVIENEIGSVSVDGGLLEGAGDYAVTNMLSGCACCTLLGSLPEAVLEIERDLNPALLVIEATGIAVPRNMLEAVKPVANGSLRVCVLADASRWRRMLGPMGVVLGQQLGGADLVCMSKADLVSEEEIAFVEESVISLGCRAPTVPLAPGNPLSAALISYLMGVEPESANPVEEDGGGAGNRYDAAPLAGGSPSPCRHHELEGVSVQVAGSRGVAEVTVRSGRDVAVVSGDVVPADGRALSVAQLVRLMRDVTIAIELRGGLVGHAKAFARSHDRMVRASSTDTDRDIDVLGDASIALDSESDIRIAVIAVGMDSDELCMVLAGKIACLLNEE